MSQAKNNVNTILNTVAAAQTAATQKRRNADSQRKIAEGMLSSSGQSPDKQSWFSRMFDRFGNSGALEMKTRGAMGSSSQLTIGPDGKLSRRGLGSAISTRADQENRFAENRQTEALTDKYLRSSKGSASGYGDNFGSMNDIFKNKPALIFLYVLKFARIIVIFGALYLASKTFQSRYVNNVFVNNENPPNLTTFVIIYVAIETIFMSLLLFILYLLGKIMTNDSGEGILTPEIISMFAFDYVASSVIIALIGLMLAVVIMKKKYFRYRTDGLRAIRSLQEMMLNVAIVALLFPYFALQG